MFLSQATKDLPFLLLFMTEFRTTSPWVTLPPPTSDTNLESWTSCLPIIKWAEQCFITDLMWLSLAGLLSAPGYAVLTQVIFCCGLLMLPQNDRVMCLEFQWGAMVFCFGVSPLQHQIKSEYFEKSLLLKLCCVFRILGGLQIEKGLKMLGNFDCKQCVREAILSWQGPVLSEIYFKVQVSKI